MNTQASLTRAEVRAIDRAAVEEFGLPAIVLMENAGRGAAECIVRIARELSSSERARIVAVVCGGGNNGGDGYVVARHLANDSLAVEIFAVGSADQLTPEASVMRRVADRMGIPIHDVSSEAALALMLPRLARSHILVDALLGTGFEGLVRPATARLIEQLNALRRAAVDGNERRIVALDVPSGLDCDRGEPSNATVVADVTVTFVAHKTGFSSPRAAPYLGRIEVVSIGAPKSLIARVQAARA
jgi:NAD(P)H-hydrate epimerase